jgi:hypothetical protein
LKLKWVAILLVLAFSFAVLIFFLGVYGIPYGLLWAVLLLVITNLEVVAGITALLYKTLRKLGFWFEKNAVEKRLELMIGSASRRVNEETGVDVLPHGIDVKWDEPRKQDAFLDRGKMVVCLEPSENEDRNLARATLMFVQEDLIAPSQRFVNIPIMRSLCFAVSRKMLMMDRKIHALKCMSDEYIEPEIAKNPKIKTYLSGLESIDSQGYLSRILLREFSELDARLSPALTNSRARVETKAFSRMLRDVAAKREEEDVNLDFTGQVFRIGFLLVARARRLTRDFDISSFVRIASLKRQKGIDKVYVLARGSNVGLAKLIISEIEKAKLYLKNKEWEYTSVGPRLDKSKTVTYYVAELSIV